MTIVIVLQILVGTLAALLLLEAWLGRREREHRAQIDVESDSLIEFHPELMVHWDDEAAHARTSPCARGVTRCERSRAALAHAAQRRTFER